MRCFRLQESREIGGAPSIERVASREIYRNPVLVLREDDIRRANGATVTTITIAGREIIANPLDAIMIRLLTPTRRRVRPVGTVDAIDDRVSAEPLRVDGHSQAAGRAATPERAANRDPAGFDTLDQLQTDRLSGSDASDQELRLQTTHCRRRNGRAAVAGQASGHRRRIALC